MQIYVWLRVLKRFLFIGLIVSIPIAVFARVTVPSGTIFRLRMETGLSSETARIGDHFTASLISPILIDNRIIIPVGTRIGGHVTSVTPAKRLSRSGTIGIGFDSILLSDGRSVFVQGELVSINTRPEDQRIDEEGHVKGGDTDDRSVVFIGGGVGVGAVIGAISGGGRGAAAGAGTGAAMGTAAVLLMKGNEARVAPGTQFGMRLVRSVNIDGNGSAMPPNLNYSSRDMIRRAQQVLSDKGFYDGPADGLTGPRTRTAIRDFQHSRNLAETGQLDERTVQELGIGPSPSADSNPGNRPDPRNSRDTEIDRGAARPGAPVSVRVMSATAERTSDGNIRVTVSTEVNTGGWRVFADNSVTDDTLDIYARGLPPEGMATQVISQLTIDTIVTGDLRG